MARHGAEGHRPGLSSPQTQQSLPGPRTPTITHESSSQMSVFQRKTHYPSCPQMCWFEGSGGGRQGPREGCWTWVCWQASPPPHSRASAQAHSSAAADTENCPGSGGSGLALTEARCSAQEFQGGRGGQRWAEGARVSSPGHGEAGCGRSTTGSGWTGSPRSIGSRGFDLRGPGGCISRERAPRCPQPASSPWFCSGVLSGSSEETVLCPPSQRKEKVEGPDCTTDP